MSIKINKRSPVKAQDTSVAYATFDGKENAFRHTTTVEKKSSEMSVDLGVFGTS